MVGSVPVAQCRRRFVFPRLLSMAFDDRRFSERCHSPTTRGQNNPQMPGRGDDAQPMQVDPEVPCESAANTPDIQADTQLISGEAEKAPEQRYHLRERKVMAAKKEVAATATSAEETDNPDCNPKRKRKVSRKASFATALSSAFSLLDAYRLVGRFETARPKEGSEQVACVQQSFHRRR